VQFEVFEVFRDLLRKNFPQNCIMILWKQNFSGNLIYTDNILYVGGSTTGNKLNYLHTVAFVAGNSHSTPGNFGA